MDIKQKLTLLEELLDKEEGELKAENKLEDVAGWDSMAALALIVLIDDEFGKELSMAEIRKFKTVQDIIDIMEK